MAFSFDSYVGDGATTNFNLNFPYIDQSHVTVTVDGVGTSFTWVSSSVVQVSPAPANGTAVVVRRTTPKATRLVNFQNASILDEAVMDLDSEQSLYISQEAFDASDNSLQENADGYFDAESKIIKNAADPVDAQDVVTKNHIATDVLPTVQASEAAAAASASAASTSETNAAASAAAAAVSDTNADASEAAAAASAAAAATSETNAGTSETNAAASAAQAALSVPVIGVGDASKHIVVNAGETAYELVTPPTGIPVPQVYTALYGTYDLDITGLNLSADKGYWEFGISIQQSGYYGAVDLRMYLNGDYTDTNYRHTTLVETSQNLNAPVILHCPASHSVSGKIVVNRVDASSYTYIGCEFTVHNQANTIMRREFHSIRRIPSPFSNITSIRFSGSAAVGGGRIIHYRPYGS